MYVFAAYILFFFSLSVIKTYTNGSLVSFDAGM